MTVEQLIEELTNLPLTANVYVAVEVVEGHEVRVVKNGIDAVKFEDEDVIMELG